MSRRIAFALVSTALASIVLVGLGVLAISRLGATDRATEDVTNALELLASAADGELTLPRLDRLGEFGSREFDLDTLVVVLVTNDGGIVALDLRRAGQNRRNELTGETLPFVLSGDEYEQLADEGRVLRVGGRQVVGVQLLDSDRLTNGQLLAALATQSVSVAAPQAISWFLLSSVVVLVGATVAGVRLARRLVRPIQEIQAATTAIAAGDLNVRVAGDGPGELGELGRSVNRMAQDLSRSRDLEQQFLLSVSHDLRTPLTAISGYAEALQDGAVQDPASAGAIIGSHADRLDRLVGDLLDLAKLDADRFSFQMATVDLAVVAGRTASGLAPEAGQGDVEVVAIAHAGPKVEADPDRLAQAIGNLVTNAISFATETVTVTTTLEGMPPTAVVTVDDDGPGFAPEDLPHVFDRLYIGAARPRRAENPSGLGLAIVRELISAMGGTVEASNRSDGQGARLRIALPATNLPAIDGDRNQVSDLDS